MNNGEIISTQDEKSVQIMAEKPLEVNVETTGIDYNSLLANIVQCVNVGDILTHVEKGVEYVVQIPTKFRDEINAGELMLNENSTTGVIWPSLYKELDNGKRQIVGNLPIKKKEVLTGGTFQGIAQSYHNIYLQQQMSQLAEIMNKTYRVVERIELGQKDDRIGILLAGREQILLALKMPKKDRDIQIMLGRNQISTAQKQIYQTLKTRVNSFEAIPESPWRRVGMELWHSGALREKDREFEIIQEYYALYLEATQMLAASYAICGLVDQAEQVYEIAEQDMSLIDFDSVKTLSYIHKKNDDMLYYHAVDYVTAEKEVCMYDAEEYDSIEVRVKGEKLMEVFENGRKKEISKSKS